SSILLLLSITSTIPHHTHPHSFPPSSPTPFILFFFTPPAPPDIYTLSLHDALPISPCTSLLLPSKAVMRNGAKLGFHPFELELRSEEHTSELQSLRHLVCRLLLEKKKKI